MARFNHAATIAALEQAIVGIQKRFATGQLSLGGNAYTAVTLVALFQSLIDALNAANAAKVAAQDAVAKAKSLSTTVMPVHADLIAYVASTLGRSASVLADFGTVPTARKTPDAATQAAAVQKRDATRAAKKAALASQAKTPAASASAPATVSAPAPAATPPKASS